MTISEYMNDLALESMNVATEMACDAILCELYSDSNSESDVAAESVDLIFDDEDAVSGYYEEPATEAGFLKNMGNKFKSVINSIKEWFQKIAATIGSWIKGFVESIARKIAESKAKRIAANKAKLEIDIESENDSYDTAKAKLDSRKDDYNKILNDPKATADKKAKAQAALTKLEDEYAKLNNKHDAKLSNLILQKCKFAADLIQDGINRANATFKNTEKVFDTIQDVLLKIEQTSVNKKSIIGDISKQVGNANAEDNLKKVKNSVAEQMVTKLEGEIEKLDNYTSDMTKLAEGVNKAIAEFKTAAGDNSTCGKAIEKIGFKLTQDSVVADAKRIKDTCEKKAKDAENLSKLFGDAPTDGSKDTRPVIAKALSTYSSAAKQIVAIAKDFLSIASKSEMFIVYSGMYNK